MTHEEAIKTVVRVAKVAIDGYRLNDDDKLFGLMAIKAITSGEYSQEPSPKQNKEEDASKEP